MKRMTLRAILSYSPDLDGLVPYLDFTALIINPFCKFIFDVVVLSKAILKSILVRVITSMFPDQRK
jgi:hypothetical protein